MISPPSFAKGGPVDAVAEFSAFIIAVGESGASLLAELSDLNSNGAFADIPASDSKATTASDLYCRVVDGWAVFYTARRYPFEITVLHVASLNPHPFRERESEAVRRLNQLR